MENSTLTSLSILSANMLHPAVIVSTVWLDAGFKFSERRIVKHAFSICLTFIELGTILFIHRTNMLQMHWLAVVWTIVALCLEVCYVSNYISASVFRISLRESLQTIESM